MKIIVLIVFFLTGCYLSNVDKEWIIEPGKRVGRIIQSTTENELKTIYGEENVEATEIGLGEGETIEGTVVFKGTPNEIEIIWKDLNKRNIDRIIFRKTDSKWVTADGIKVGMTLDDLQKLNKEKISFYGFEWDYSGTIISWNKGKLEKKYQLGDKFGLNFVYKNQPPIEKLNLVVGDIELKSDNPLLKNMDVRIGSFALIF